MLADSGQLRMFGANLYLLIGALICLAITLVLILVAWTATRAWLWKSRQRRSVEELARRRLDPDGNPYPPTGRGVCEICNRAYDRVYYLPTGQRRCAGCYQRGRFG